MINIGQLAERNIVFERIINRNDKYITAFNSNRIIPYGIKYFREMIDIGVSDVGSDNSVPSLAFEALLHVLLRELPKCLARRHAE